MGHPIRVTRSVELPDPFRVERCRRLPELGPRILFFSGGSALRSLSGTLKRYTHNSTHVITAFDSGGSSAKLREAFDMLSIGDLRNRLLALADDSVQGNPDVARLFSHRLPTEVSDRDLRTELDTMIDGSHDLVRSLPNSMQRIIRTHLRSFGTRIDVARFDLRGASIGNLVLSSGYLDNERHIDSVLFLFSKLVGALGEVLPVTEECAHLRAHLSNGETLVGQHRFGPSGSSGPPAAIERIDLVDSLTSPSAVEIPVGSKVRSRVENADLICYPMGSFFSSVIANLLPVGTAEAIDAANCPRVYVPNTGVDPEQSGRSVASCVEALLRSLDGYPVDHLLNFVVLDRSDEVYEVAPERTRLESLGIRIIEGDLVNPDGSGEIDPLALSELLVSLC